MRVSPTTVPVLLQGEVGVGKSVLSRFIHGHSAAAHGPYTSINCAALGGPSPIKDPFLPLQGALGFVPANSDDASPSSRPGTIFLEQVSELTPRLQQQLARSLAESDECATTDWHEAQERVRIICSNTRNLRRDVKLGHFQRDLFHRLVVVVIDVPPLRNRLEDLPGIAEYLRLRHGAQLAGTDPPFSQEMLARMLTYQWPGNVRELENFVCRYVVLGGEGSSLEDSVALFHSCADADIYGCVTRGSKQNWIH